MKKLLSLVAMTGLLIAATVAQAEQWDFNIGPSLMGNPPAPVEGASGTYHVTIKTTGTAGAYEVMVMGNNDGNYQDGPLGQPGPPPDPPVAKSGIGRISLNFYNMSDGGIDIANATSGSSTAYSGPTGGIGQQNNVGGPRNLAFGSGGGTWDSANNGGGSVVFTTPFLERYVAPHGGNSFTGLFTLTNVDWGRVGVSLQDSGQQWSGEHFRSAQFVPESSSLALLLPGLVPLALVIRRRRRA